MLTDKQEKWLEHLSDSDTTKITPFNPQVKNDFLKLKKELEAIVGKDVDITLRGSSSFGISGKGELDIYIPVSLDRFDTILQKLIKAYGKPGSLYPNERSRFNRFVNDTKAEVFLINSDADGWLQLNIFEDWLKNHPEDLQQYEEFKASLEGKSGRACYTEKTAFFNSIIDKASKEKSSDKVHNA
ncbi:MAG: GrpB family protein [Candidatus Blackburnbacteria bacterium]|nr:GrpB family protein [Candidatus Blackburnbacteria bacterium]